MSSKVTKFIADKLWFIVTRDYRRGTLGKMDFMNYICEFKKSHPEFKGVDDIKLLKEWQHGKFNLIDPSKLISQSKRHK